MAPYGKDGTAGPQGCISITAADQNADFPAGDGGGDVVQRSSPRLGFMVPALPNHASGYGSVWIRFRFGSKHKKYKTLNKIETRLECVAHNMAKKIQRLKMRKMQNEQLSKS